MEKASGKAHGEYPSADETTIVDSRQDSEEGDRSSKEDAAIKCADILVNLRALIKEANAAIQLIQAKTKPAVDDGEKDNRDIERLNTMIEEAQFTIEGLDSKISNSGKEGRMRLLFDDAQCVISHVMVAPITAVVETGSLDIKKTLSCTDEFAVKSAISNNEGSALDKSTKDASLENRESVLERLMEEVRLLTGLGDDTSKRIATIESVAEKSMEDEDSVTTVMNLAATNEVDNRNFLVLMVDMVEEFGGMLAEDSAKLAEKAPFPQCW